MKTYTRHASSVLALLAIMAVQSGNAAPFSIVASDTPLAVPPSGTMGTTVSTVTVPSGSGVTTINDFNVFVDLDHTWTGDLVITIEHVDTGTAAMLFNRYGSSGDDITDVTFDDEGSKGSISSGTSPFGPGSFVPSQLLNTFDGESIEGTWKLTVDDRSLPDAGTLYSFRIEGDASPSDSDGDGVDDMSDLCPDTAIPETTVPVNGLEPNHYALMDSNNAFDTVASPDLGDGQGAVFTTIETGGCSCEQILNSYHLGLGHFRNGCSVGIMKRWVEDVHD